MNEEEVYKIINKEPIEYANLLKDIKTRADSNKNLDGKSECKLLMRYLKKQWKEIERLNNIIKEVRETLINSKEYKMAKEMNLTSKMSVLIELLEILDKGGILNEKK